MLAKIPKLTSIFPTVALSKSKPDEVQISTDTCNSDTLSRSMDVQSVVTEAAAEGTVDHLETTFSAASPVSVDDTDLSKWPEVLSQDMREYWTQCGSEDCQHPDVNFKASKIVDGDRQARYFSKCLFTYLHPFTERRILRMWLCYFHQLDTCSASTASYSLVSAFPSLEGTIIGKMLLEDLKIMNGPMFTFHLPPN